MKFIKEKIPIIMGVIVFIALCGGLLYYMENGESYYYTQIDNTKVESITSDDEMKYKYTLICYNENGKEKELSFKTSRELKDKAYLKLKVMAVSGVNNWSEIQYNELPTKIQEKYSK